MDDFNKQAGSSSYGEGGSGTAARMKEEVYEQTANIKDRIAEQTANIKDKVADFGRRASDRIDDSRVAAADALGKTASTLHTSGDRVSDAAHTTAERLQATANYVRSKDLKSMGHDIEDVVKRYPGLALAAAALVGFLVARGMRATD